MTTHYLPSQIVCTAPTTIEGFLSYYKEINKELELYEALTGMKMDEKYVMDSIITAMNSVQSDKKMTELRNLETYGSFTAMYNSIVISRNTNVSDRRNHDKPKVPTIHAVCRMNQLT